MTSELIKCPCCETETNDVERRRLNTNYYNDDLNFLTSCQQCYEDTLAYYAERWQDYYANCM